MTFNFGKCIVFADKKLEKGSRGKVQGILEERKYDKRKSQSYVQVLLPF